MWRVKEKQMKDDAIYCGRTEQMCAFILNRIYISGISLAV